MKLKQEVSDDKLHGRYYTPKRIADYVTNWVLTQNEVIHSILEPSVGDGVFLECISESHNKLDNTRIIALEVDERASIEAAKKIDNIELVNSWDNARSCNRAVIQDDFYKAYRNGLDKQQYQAILGNPPYIRYQYLDESQRIEQSEILVKNGMSSNKLINAWVSFTVACVSCMADNSRIGFVLPAELLQVKYSEDLRKFLTSHLNKITIITFSNLVFEGIEQEVVLLLGEKIGGHKNHLIRIIQFDDVDQMESQNIDNHEFFEADISSSKWTRYFLPDKNLESVQYAEKDDRLVRFSSIAKCEVGITTGNNNYFCINNETVRTFRLAEFCTPLIARSVNIRGIEFTENDWKFNVDSGARTYLLNLTPFNKEQFNKGVLNYIKHGEETEQNSTYKCRIRDEWYKVPSVWSPDAFFLRRNYLYPKFMLNTDEVKAVSTDTMHRVVLKNPNNKKRIVVAYYTSVALLFSELEGRSYGGGVLEILPGEVGNIMLPNIFDQRIVSDTDIEALFKTTDNYIRSHDDIIELLEINDQAILIDKLGFTNEEVTNLRNAWIALRNRRMVRGGKTATDLVESYD